MNARRRPTVLTEIVLVLALVLVACAEQGPEPEPGQLAVIADQTTQAGTARTVMTMNMTMSQFSSEMRMEGVVDTATEALHVTMRVRITGQGAPRHEVDGEMIALDGVLYHSGGLAQESRPDLPDGHWVRQPMPEGMGGGTMLPGMPDQNSPMAFVEQLALYGGDITTLGRDRVRGTQTTHWRIVTTYEEMLQAQASEEVRQQMEDALADAPADMLGTPVVIEVWADDDNLLRRMRMDLDLSAALAGQTPQDQSSEAAMRWDMELYDYGVDVTISAPPEDRVVELPEGSAGMGLDPEPMAEPGIMQDSAAGIGVGTSFLPGSPPQDLPTGLPPLPYPEGAELVSATSEVVRYTVPSTDEDALGDLERFHELYLPQYGWSVIVRGAGATADHTGTTQQSASLEFSGYEREGTVDIADRGTESLEVVVTFRPIR